MQEHEIELSNRYVLKLNENRIFILYKMEFNDRGGYSRTGGQVYKNLHNVVKALTYLELMQEDVNTLADILKVLKAIQAEVQRITEIQETYAQG